ncbi:WYL domain-containing protein [Paenibacillus sp. CAU 1782]
MNPFEKIFNYQLLSRLENRGTYLISAHERAWLKSMLNHPSASEAFLPGTLAKLQAILQNEAEVHFEPHLIHKAASREVMVYHPLIRQLRRAIGGGYALTISFALKNGETRVEHHAFPYKLEYSMVKREWYLLWLSRNKRKVMSTRLNKISEVKLHAQPLSPDTVAARASEAEAGLAAALTSAEVAVMPAYNGELSRILYAFSCFERDVRYDAEKDEYVIKLHFSLNESEYVLSKLRFLGKRVRVISGDRLIERMRQTAAWALARYEGTSTAASRD